MKQTVQLRYLKMTPRKVRLVADLVRGLSVNEAEAQLLHERRRAAKPLLTLLRSAIAAARVTKKATDTEVLRVEEIRVDQGPMLKRSLPRARGMATPIHKVMSHVTLTLGEFEPKKPARFKIVVPKKAKLPPEGRPKAKKDPSTTTRAGQSGSGGGRNDKGFFRKIFNRKAV